MGVLFLLSMLGCCGKEIDVYWVCERYTDDSPRITYDEACTNQCEFVGQLVEYCEPEGVCGTMECDQRLEECYF